MKIKILIIFFISFYSASGQTNCLDGEIKTNTIGNGNEHLKYDLKFIINKDSIVLINRSSEIVFKILNSKCNWDVQFENGNSYYKIITQQTGKLGSLSIHKSNSQGSIKLNYDGDIEARVFSIENQ